MTSRAPPGRPRWSCRRDGPRSVAADCRGPVAGGLARSACRAALRATGFGLSEEGRVRFSPAAALLLLLLGAFCVLVRGHCSSPAVDAPAPVLRPIPSALGSVPEGL